MSAPKEIDRAKVLNELVHRWAETTAGDEEPGVAWVLDQLTELDILRYKVPFDDPRRAKHGAVWQHDDTSIVVKVTDDQWVSVPGGVGFADADLATGEWRAVDAVYGTPAWKPEVAS